MKLHKMTNYYVRDHLTVEERNELDERVSANMINQRFFETLTEQINTESSRYATGTHKL